MADNTPRRRKPNQPETEVQSQNPNLPSEDVIKHVEAEVVEEPTQDYGASFDLVSAKVEPFKLAPKIASRFPDLKFDTKKFNREDIEEAQAILADMDADFAQGVELARELGAMSYRMGHRWKTIKSDRIYLRVINPATGVPFKTAAEMAEKFWPTYEVSRLDRLALGADRIDATAPAFERLGLPRYYHELHARYGKDDAYTPISKLVKKERTDLDEWAQDDLASLVGKEAENLTWQTAVNRTRDELKAIAEKETDQAKREKALAEAAKAMPTADMIGLCARESVETILKNHAMQNLIPNLNGYLTKHVKDVEEKQRKKLASQGNGQPQVTGSTSEPEAGRAKHGETVIEPDKALDKAEAAALAFLSHVKIVRDRIKAGVPKDGIANPAANKPEDWIILPQDAFDYLSHLSTDNRKAITEHANAAEDAMRDLSKTINSRKYGGKIIKTGGQQHKVAGERIETAPPASVPEANDETTQKS